MNPRCQGQQAAGHWTGFQCVLDAGHAPLAMAKRKSSNT